jgi:hypothetical protein
MSRDNFDLSSQVAILAMHGRPVQLVLRSRVIVREPDLAETVKRWLASVTDREEYNLRHR